MGMLMSYRFTPEVWVKEWEAFIFICREPRSGKRWTFRVPRSTLKDLQPHWCREETFDCFRDRIYRAALERIEMGSDKEHDEISAFAVLRSDGMLGALRKVDSLTATLHRREELASSELPTSGGAMRSVN
jgi:hypothetical protein